MTRTRAQARTHSRRRRRIADRVVTGCIVRCRIRRPRWA